MDVLATLRALHPRQSYDALERILASKRAWQKTRAALQILGYGLGGLVDVDRPVYAVTTKDKRAALSIDVVPGRVAEVADHFRLAPGDDGGFHVRPGAPETAKGAPLVCEIARAPAGALRLVCGDDGAAVRDLAPVLAGMTADPNGADVHVELGGDALRSGLGERIAVSTEKHSASYLAGDALGVGLMTAFFGDLDAMTFDASLATDLAASFALRFRSDASPLVRALTGHPGRTSAPSAAFWRLPADASMAFFTMGGVAEDLLPLKTALLDGIEAGLTDTACPDEIHYLDTRLRALFLTGGPLVVGLGNDVPLLEKALEKALAKQSDAAKQAARGAARQALAGWVLAEVDEPGERWISALRELTASDAKFAGCARPAAPEVQEPMRSTTTAPAVVASWHLPAGTLHLVDRHVPRKEAPKDTRPAYTSHVYVVPDGDRTWFAMGEDEAMLVSRLKTALAGATDRTLEGRTGLESLRTAALGGGFVTPEGVKLLAADRGDDAADERFEEAQKSVKALRTSPLRSTTPYAFTWQSTPLQIATGMRLPVQTLVELASLLE